MSLIIGQKVTITADVYSTVKKGKLYAKAGEKATVIAIRPPLIGVRTDSGQTFYVEANKLQ